jgi:hypothetical protein
VYPRTLIGEFQDLAHQTLLHHRRNRGLRYGFCFRSCKTDRANGNSRVQKLHRIKVKASDSSFTETGCGFFGRTPKKKQMSHQTPSEKDKKGHLFLIQFNARISGTGKAVTWKTITCAVRFARSSSVRPVPVEHTDPTSHIQHDEKSPRHGPRSP